MTWWLPTPKRTSEGPSVGHNICDWGRRHQGLEPYLFRSSRGSSWGHTQTQSVIVFLFYSDSFLVSFTVSGDHRHYHFRCRVKSKSPLEICMKRGLPTTRGVRTREIMIPDL